MYADMLIVDELRTENRKII